MSSRRSSGRYGELQIITIANPGAGADFSYLLPANYDYRIQSVTGLITTSAVVATRQIVLGFFDGGGVTLWRSKSDGGTAASLVHQYVWAPGAHTIDVSGDVNKWMSLPHDFYLPAGCTIGVTTALLDAGDQWSNIRLILERWRV